MCIVFDLAIFVYIVFNVPSPINSNVFILYILDTKHSSTDIRKSIVKKLKELHDQSKEFIQQYQDTNLLNIFNEVIQCIKQPIW